MASYQRGHHARSCRRGLQGCVLACALAVLVAGRPGAAQQGAVNLAGQVKLAQLIDLAAERLNLKVEYDPGMLGNVTVTLRLRDGLSDEELWLITNQLLAARGFASVQVSGSDLISITRVATAGTMAPVEHPHGAEGAEGQAAYLSVLVELVHREPKDVTDAVQPLLSKPGGSIVALGRTNFVLVSDFRARVNQALEIIDRLDAPGEDGLIKTIPVANLPANQLIGLLNTASKALSTVRGTPLKGMAIPVPDGNAVVVIASANELPAWRDMIERFDQRQSVETRSYTPRFFAVSEVARLIESVARDDTPRGSGNLWRVVPEELTGTVIVTATAAEHAQIEMLIARLDDVPGVARRPVRAFPIRNRSVNDILDVLLRLVDAGVLEAATFELGAASPNASQRTQRRILPPGAEPLIPTGPQGGRETASAVATGPAPGEDLQLTLTADEGTNTLIAIGEARLLAQLEQLIETLDVRQPQVMIEVIVATLSDADTFDLGVELERMLVAGSTKFAIASLFGLGTPGLDMLEQPTGSGATAVVFNPGDMRVLIRALETINKGRLLNIPKVLVSNNQQAVLESVLQQPFTATNASSTVATTAFGGTQDAGTTVTVRPQIAEGDHLLLEYSVSLSSFTGDSTDPSLPPPRQQNNLSSAAMVPDGYTVVVGGLEAINESEAQTMVPLIGHIPLLGELFKSRSRSSSRNRFYVFIRANVLRKNQFEDLKYISDQIMAREQIDDGWPDVLPRVIR